MSDAAGSYDFKIIEAKWQRYWHEHKTFRTPQPGTPDFDPDKPKYYVLDMFPYPSGVGLHVGHPLGYIATDIFSRYMRMRGYNVLHPMGYDAFGLPAEQYAVEHGVPPRETTEKNIANMRAQLERLGMGYDWDREIATTDIGYYKWTQWIFLQLYNSWYDPSAGAARPIVELEHRLQQQHLVIRFDGRIVPADMKGMQEFTGMPIGTRTWVELSQEERRQVLDDHRLAYLDEVPVNWCPALGTVLANEEVTNEGRSDRGNHPVFRRPLRQWMLRITRYADRLEKDLEMVDWPEPIKLMQENWIGRSEGAEVDFSVDGHEEVIRVYTTRPDTLFGATYMVLAPEHELVEQVTTADQRAEVENYVARAGNRSDLERTAETKEKTGVFTGGYAVNPVNEQKIPIWVADYVLMGYGTGAIMAVPAHDTRDFEFAKQYNLPITPVVKPSKRWFADYLFRNWDVPLFPTIAEAETPLATRHNINTATGKAYDDAVQYTEENYNNLVKEYLSSPKQFAEAYTGEGTAINSGPFDGLPTAEFKRQITAWLEEKEIGKGAVNYKLRDWLFSRQRYWGEPFPILHDAETDEVFPLDESELPVTLPPIDDYRPQATDDPKAPPAPPLGRASDWVNVRGYVNEMGYVQTLSEGQKPPSGAQVRSFRRELNTMPQWAGSCWYYLRYLDNRNEEEMVDPEVESYWMAPRSGEEYPPAGGVDLYVGGAEHAVLHLLYARFWHKALFDLGHVSSPEPFGRLFNQGYIQAYAYQDPRGMYVPVEEVVEEQGEGKQVRYLRKSTGEELTRNLGKMGKSLKNAVSPDEICNGYGTDTLRAYEMYMGPLEASKPWSTRDIIGLSRFLQQFWRRFVNADGTLKVVDDPPEERLRRLLHKTIRKVTQDMANLRFNTAIAAMIELNNELKGETLSREIAEPFVKILSPIAPHICEELWQRIRGTQWKASIATEPWPGYEESLCVEAEVEVPVQVNGKLRSRLTMPVDAAGDQVLMQQAAMDDPKVQAELTGKTVRKVICIPGRMVNIVAN